MCVDLPPGAAHQVEHALVAVGRHQPRHQALALVLHGAEAFAEHLERVRGVMRLDPHQIGRQISRDRGDPFGLEAREQILTRETEPVHP